MASSREGASTAQSDLNQQLPTALPPVARTRDSHSFTAGRGGHSPQPRGVGQGSQPKCAHLLPSAPRAGSIQHTGSPHNTSPNSRYHNSFCENPGRRQVIKTCLETLDSRVAGFPGTSTTHGRSTLPWRLCPGVWSVPRNPAWGRWRQGAPPPSPAQDHPAGSPTARRREQKLLYPGDIKVSGRYSAAQTSHPWGLFM